MKLACNHYTFLFHVFFSYKFDQRLNHEHFHRNYWTGLALINFREKQLIFPRVSPFCNGTDFCWNA